MQLSWGEWIAVYAAVVATGALFLEIRRWFESRPRLYIDIATGMVTVGVPHTQGETLVSVTVHNRGAAPTTINNLSMISYSSWWHRLRGTHAWAAVVLTGPPSAPIPHLLPPGGQWKGFILEDEDLRERADSQRVYVCVWASHRDKPIRAHLEFRRRGSPPEDEEEVGPGPRARTSR